MPPSTVNEEVPKLPLTKTSSTTTAITLTLTTTRTSTRAAASTANMDPEYEAKLKAEARAYALSSTTTKSSKRKASPTNAASAVVKKQAGYTAANTNNRRPTSLSIYRPDRPNKVQKTHAGAYAGTGTSTGTSQATTNGHSGMPLPVHHLAHGVFAGGLDAFDDDYQRFVRSLGLDDSLFAGLDNDDEDFHLSDIEDEDDFEDEDDTFSALSAKPDSKASGTSIAKAKAESIHCTPPLSSPLSASPLTLPDFDATFHHDLEEELGNLLEEDMEAAVQSLMTSKRPSTPSSIKPAAHNPSPKTPKTNNKKKKKDANTGQEPSPATPLRETARQGRRTQVTYQQSQQLRRLLTRHYQLLVQQSILAVRAAHMQKIHKEKTDFLSGETADDLAEILDGAVGMLQDLDQNRKDAIRNSIQLEQSSGNTANTMKGRRSLLPSFSQSSDPQEQEAQLLKDKPLTRSAFSKTLQEQGSTSSQRTAFDIPGLINLGNTFATIDKSVEGAKGQSSILESATHTEACRQVLRQAAANLDEAFVPGVKDLSENFCDAKEFLGENFEAPCNEEQHMFLRRNRNLFSSGEDNLVLRGVNLYGEKQWILIADRYLPDRSVNIISQRYNKLCVMMYKAHGISIDEKGALEYPPKLESVDDIDEERVKELQLGTVEPPAILNVHRWSFEEDLTLLKAVPIMGHMWAELGARLIPHRDRGHLRKRYQVLERRVKAVTARNTKGDSSTMKAPRAPAPKRPASNGVPAQALAKPQQQKAEAVAASNGSVKMLQPRNAASQSAGNKKNSPPMSLEKAAASLAFLRPPQDAENDTEDVEQSKQQPQPKSDALPAMDSQFNAESAFSRMAFEKLVEGNNEEWSQMSRVKKMMENGAESVLPHPTKSAMFAGTSSKLPHMHLDTNSMSGLSILHSEASKQATTDLEMKPSSKSNASIMSRVLERSEAKESKKSRASTDDKPTSMESPRKRSLKSTTFSPVPTTPKRTNFFSTSGTPIGLSPGFRPSPGTRHGASITLTPNVTYSPAPSAVMRLMTEPSNDEIHFCDFQISEESQKELEGNNKEGAKQHDPNPPPLTPSKNSLMLDDLEAISALNSLSNSPFRQAKTCKAGNGAAVEEKRSLFATVIGGLKDKDPKTRLQF